MRQRALRQRQLFDEEKPFQPPQLPPEVQQAVTRLLVQWMQTLARAIGGEVSDEQDRR
jgi:hypothetical protein